MKAAHLALEQNNQTLLYTLSKRLNEQEEHIYLLALDYKRRKLLKKAGKCWLKLSALEKYKFVALEELAKYHEHKTGEYKQALYFIEKALIRLRIIDELNDNYRIQDQIVSFILRLKRLREKIS